MKNTVAKFFLFLTVYTIPKMNDTNTIISIEAHINRITQNILVKKERMK